MSRWDGAPRHSKLFALLSASVVMSSEVETSAPDNDSIWSDLSTASVAPLGMASAASVVMSSEVETSAPDNDSTWSDLSTASVAPLGMASAASVYIWTSSTYTVSPRHSK